MIISLKWLCDFVDIKEYLDKPEALAEVLTRAGLEVENITNKAKDFQSVVMGHILEKDKHPNADKLSLCKVSTGEGVVHQIVCGAQNHKAGDWVVVALPGAVLPGNFVIKQSVIRGVDSGGMLCSQKELGLAKESEGILILPEGQGRYMSFAEYAGFNDVTFELKVTPNRADCLSHFGLAREMSCLLGKSLHEIPSKLANHEGLVVGSDTAERIALHVDDALACPRYTGRWISEVKVAASPEWLVQRLQAVGLNSINNVVDISNYVMMELGQPMHAFDAAKIRGGQIRVGRAKAGVAFRGLDDQERKLNAEDLIIADEQGPVALAGVIGGLGSGVSDQTQDIFLESAYFDPAVVRKSQRGHGISTDSAYRFTRGVDPELCLKALNRATELILNSAGGKASEKAYDLYPKPVQKKIIDISLKTLSERLGYTAQAALFVKILKGLACEVESTGTDEFRVHPPTFRFDLETDMDLVEEYARIHGYDQIPETLPALRVEPLVHDLEFMRSSLLRKIMREQGYNQALNMGFSSESFQKNFSGPAAAWNKAGLVFSAEPIRLLNALSEEQNIMRQTLTVGLFRNLLHNVYQGNVVGRLFELGKVFALPAAAQYEQSSNLALMAWGHVEGLWNKNSEYPMVFELKEGLENLLQGMGIRSYEWVPVDSAGPLLPFLHRGQQSLLKVQGRVIGFIGSLHPSLLVEHKLRMPVALAEISVQGLLTTASGVGRFKSISRQPVIERDLALVMEQKLAAGLVAKEIEKKAGPLLQDVSIFDLYVDEKSLPGQKSVAFRMHFQDPNATLQEETINKLMDELIPHLKSKFSLSVR